MINAQPMLAVAFNTFSPSKHNQTCCSTIDLKIILVAVILVTVGLIITSAFVSQVRTIMTRAIAPHFEVWHLLGGLSLVTIALLTTLLVLRRQK